MRWVTIVAREKREEFRHRGILQKAEHGGRKKRERGSRNAEFCGMRNVESSGIGGMIFANPGEIN